MHIFSNYRREIASLRKLEHFLILRLLPLPRILLFFINYISLLKYFFLRKYFIDGATEQKKKIFQYFSLFKAGMFSKPERKRSVRVFGTLERERKFTGGTGNGKFQTARVPKHPWFKDCHFITKIIKSFFKQKLMNLQIN